MEVRRMSGDPQNYYTSFTRDELPPIREVVGDALDQPAISYNFDLKDVTRALPGSSKSRYPGSSSQPHYLQREYTLPPILSNDRPLLPPPRNERGYTLPPLRHERGPTLPPIRSERGPTLPPLRYKSPEPVRRDETISRRTPERPPSRAAPSSSRHERTQEPPEPPPRPATRQRTRTPSPNRQSPPVRPPTYPVRPRTAPVARNPTPQPIPPPPYQPPIVPQPSSGPAKFSFNVMRPQQGDLVDVRTPSTKAQGILRPTAIIEDEDESHKRYKCDWPGCEKRYDRPSSLEVHRHTHTGTQPFPCDFPGCTRAFGVKSNMLRHARSHQPTKTRPREEIDMEEPPSDGNHTRYFHHKSSFQATSMSTGESADTSAPQRRSSYYR